MTELLYYNEPYRRSCSAAVKTVTPRGALWAVTCSRTVFYPEGGGQPADCGTLNGIPVVDTRKEGDEVLHMLSREPQFSPGDTASLELDWDHRYDYMQQHTGQHILSGVLYRDFGIGTVSVHQGEKYTTIETDQEQISEDQLFSAARKAQQIICENVPVTQEIMHEADSGISDLRREPKVSGDIRVICLGDHDRAACGGVHLERTGEVLLVSSIGMEKIRGKIRTAWMIGDRAMRDFSEKGNIIREAGTLLSVPQERLVSQVRKLIEGMKQLNYEKQGLQQQLAQHIISGMFEQGTEIDGVLTAVEVIPLENPDLIKQIGAVLPEGGSYVFCCIGKTDHDIRWVIRVSESLSLPFDYIRKNLLPIIDAKGGGKPPLWQGVGRNPEGAELFRKELQQWIAEYIRSRRRGDGAN